jgi:excinuclease ABC subunit A
MDGIAFLEPNVHLFSFNNSYGACPVCEGYGNIIGIDEELVIPNTALSIYENAIFPWRGESMGWYRDELVKNAYKFDFPIHKPFLNSPTSKGTRLEQQRLFPGIERVFQGTRGEKL